MSKKRGSLLSYRPDIKVVDATLRDGGLVNDFRFTEDFVRDLYAANVAAGIDYMEFGYKASKDIFEDTAKIWATKQRLTLWRFPTQRNQKSQKHCS